MLQSFIHKKNNCVIVSQSKEATKQLPPTVVCVFLMLKLADKGSGSFFFVLLG